MKREMIIGRGSERGTDAESFTGKETDGVGGGRGNGVRMFELDAWHCCCCCVVNLMKDGSKKKKKKGV